MPEGDLSPSQTVRIVVLFSFVVVFVKIKVGIQLNLEILANIKACFEALNKADYHLPDSTGEALVNPCALETVKLGSPLTQRKKSRRHLIQMI